MPQISVIMPVYQKPELLRAAVSSIQAQTFQNWELILVDDGSPDGCGKVCDALSLGDARLRVIHQENRGQGKARNAGIQLAKGQYLLFADSDDLLSPKALEILYSCIVANNYDFVRCRFSRFSGSVPGESPAMKEPEGEFLGSDAIWQNLILPLIGRGTDGVELCGTACTTLYASRLIDRNQLTFPDPTRVQSEDLLFNLQYLSKAERGLTIRDVLYHYRICPASFTTRNEDAGLFSRLLLLDDELRAFCVDNKKLNDDSATRIAARLLEGASVHIKKRMELLPYKQAKAEVAKLVAHPRICSALQSAQKGQLPFLAFLCFAMARKKLYAPLYMLIHLYNRLPVSSR